MKIALSPEEKLRGFIKFLDVKLHRRPLTVSIEVTKRCNARCDFCDSWKITDHREEMADFMEVVRRFDPLVVVLTGGEPMLRRDLTAVVRRIRALPGFRYITLLTHGGLLSQQRVRELIQAGVNQINISLNYPDARQDKERGIPGLFARLERIVPKMASESAGIFTIASMLMVDNLRDAESLVHLANCWGVHIAFSGYNDVKNGNQKHFVSEEQVQELRSVCRRLVRLKRDLGNIMTSDYFFETLPEFYEKRELGGCRAGQIMLHVSPTGMVHPCAELPAIAHFTEFTAGAFRGTACGKCFDSCRAEPQAPVTLRRLGELVGLV
ncbi:MAG TPA: radical SAM protein [Anaeromyxobacteraceae bacterium]|nr:radical SAM protein [Anaeromyxobacteraceae bacterium]